MADITALVTGRSFLEGPRWRDGALYVSDMHGDAVLRVTEDGDVSTVIEVEQPSGLGWLPDGSLLISSMTRRCVMRFDGSDLAVHSDLSSLASHEINDMCVDRHGHAFVGQFGFNFFGGGASPAAAALLRVDPDGSACAVADDMQFANGMVITADQSTLLVAESFGRCITGFDLADDGSLSNRRTWAEIEDYPDGISIDTDGAVWVASPTFYRFVRIVAGGAVTGTVDTPGRHAIACEVGGADGRTLFMLTAATLGRRAESQTAKSATIETTRVWNGLETTRV
jgi:sugar lactone lactonase YvrE